ncbi:MAG: glycosyltransferase family 4 protein [Marmoricola sp.]
MRILHVTDVYRPAVGGIELFVEELAHLQSAAGNDVTVLSRQRGAGAFSSDVASVQYGRREVRLADFDIIHAHLSVFSPMTSVVMRQATVRGVPVVATVHSMWAGRGPIVKGVSVAAGWQRRQPIWTAVSSVAAREVHDMLPGAVVHVVPNAVDVEYWRDGIAKPDDVVVPEVPTLLAVNRLAARKRPMGLLHQLAEVRRLAPEQRFRARIVGAGPLEKRMRTWIDNHGMHDVVSLTGGVPRPEVRRMCHSADLFLAPAHQESFGIAALEGRAAGLPVLAMSS